MLKSIRGDSWSSIPPLCMSSLLPHDLCHGWSSSRRLPAVDGVGKRTVDLKTIWWIKWKILKIRWPFGKGGNECKGGVKDGSLDSALQNWKILMAKPQWMVCCSSAVLALLLSLVLPCSVHVLDDCSSMWLCTFPVPQCRICASVYIYVSYKFWAIFTPA